MFVDAPFCAPAKHGCCHAVEHMLSVSTLPAQKRLQVMLTASVPALQPKELGLPTTAYYTTDEIREAGHNFACFKDPNRVCCISALVGD